MECKQPLGAGSPPQITLISLNYLGFARSKLEPYAD